MQLAGDTQSLLHGSSPGGLVPGPLRFFGALLDLAKMQLPHPERYGHDPGRDEPAGRVEPLRVLIRAHTSSLRARLAGASALCSHFQLLPASYSGTLPYLRRAGRNRFPCVSWIWTALGLALRSAQAVTVISFAVRLPLTLAGNVFVSPATMPAGLRPGPATSPYLSRAKRLKTLPGSSGP